MSQAQPAAVGNIGDYEQRTRDFSWEKAAEELGLPAASENIGWLLSDRICRDGGADRTALLWEGHGGETREYSFDDLRLRSNAFARLLEELGVEAGDRVALFLDRIPELYFAFVGRSR